MAAVVAVGVLELHPHRPCRSRRARTYTGGGGPGRLRPPGDLDRMQGGWGQCGAGPSERRAVRDRPQVAGGGGGGGGGGSGERALWVVCAVCGSLRQRRQQGRGVRAPAARYGTARHGTARHCPARHGAAGPAPVQLDMPATASLPPATAAAAAVRPGRTVMARGGWMIGAPATLTATERLPEAVVTYHSRSDAVLGSQPGTTAGTSPREPPPAAGPARAERPGPGGGRPSPGWDSAAALLGAIAGPGSPGGRGHSAPSEYLRHPLRPLPRLPRAASCWVVCEVVR